MKQIDLADQDVKARVSIMRDYDSDFQRTALSRTITLIESTKEAHRLSADLIMRELLK